MNQENEQKEVITNNSENNKCLNCGTMLEEDQEFCPKCGIKKGERKIILCSKCNNEIQIGQKFCSKCGEKIKLDSNTVINSIKSKYQRKINNVNKKIILTIVIVLVVLAIVFGIFIKIKPKLFVSTEDLLVQGKYEEAYNKAKKDEKENIYYENVIAIMCKEVIDSYKDPSSFELREAWIDKSEKHIVLKTAGKNSYGGVVFSYEYITYDEDDKKYEVYCSLSDLDEEKTYSFDEYSEKLEKILKNAARTVVKKIINNDSYKVDKQIIDNINHLASEELLDSIQTLEVEGIEGTEV